MTQNLARRASERQSSVLSRWRPDGQGQGQSRAVLPLTAPGRVPPAPVPGFASGGSRNPGVFSQQTRHTDLWPLSGPVCTSPLLGKGTRPQTRALSSARAPGPRLGPAHAHNDLVLTCFQQSRPRSLPEQLEPQLPGAARVWKNSLEPPPQRSRVTGRNTDAGGESAAQVPSSCFE